MEIRSNKTIHVQYKKRVRAATGHGVFGRSERACVFTLVGLFTREEPCRNCRLIYCVTFHNCNFWSRSFQIRAVSDEKTSKPCPVPWLCSVGQSGWRGRTPSGFAASCFLFRALLIRECEPNALFSFAHDVSGGCSCLHDDDGWFWDRLVAG